MQAFFSWEYAIILGIILTAVTGAIIRHRRFSKLERVHQGFVRKYQFSGDLLPDKSFVYYGHYRQYLIQIQQLVKGDTTFVQFHIPMINPNRKALRIFKGNADTEFLMEDIIIDYPFKIPHKLGKDIQIHTNDTIFSSLILSEEVNISLHQAFQEIESGLCYIYDESLCFLSPQYLADQQALKHYENIMNLLCDIKEELKP